MIRVYMVILSAFLLSGCEFLEVFEEVESPLDEMVQPGDGGANARFANLGNVLYTLGGNSMYVQRIGTDGRLSLLQTINFNYGTRYVVRQDSLLFVGTDDARQVFSVAQPHNPVFVNNRFFSFGSEATVANGTHAFMLHIFKNAQGALVSNGLVYVVDVSNPTNMRLLNFIRFVKPIDLALHDSLLFLADQGVKIANTKDLSTLPILKAFEMDAQQLQVQGDVLLVAGHTGVSQYRIKPDLSLELLSTITTRSTP